MTDQLSTFRIEVYGRLDRMQDSIEGVREDIGELRVALARGDGAKDARRDHGRWLQWGGSFLLAVATAAASVKLKLFGN